MTDVTVWDGSTDDDWTDPTNWSNGVPSTSKIASIPGSLSTYPDLASDCTVHALLISSGATLTGGSNITVYVTGKSAGETNAPTNLYAVEINGTISGELNFNITTPSATKLDLNGSSGNINDLTINHSSCVATIQTTTTLDGDLNITAGEFNTHSLGQQLTVKGNTVVSGTLTGNNSTLIFGESGVHGSTEAGALHVESGGSLTFGSGDLTAFSGFTAKGTNTVTSTGGGDILIKGRTNNGFMNSHGHTGVNITGDYKIDFDTDALHDIRGNMAITAANITYLHGGRTYSFWTTATTNTVTFTGNLNISGSSAELNTLASGQEAADAFTVTGDAILTGNLTANDTTISLGSLRVDGTYSATSGTTIITSERSNGRAIDIVGTYTHNGGTLEIRTPADTDLRCPSSSSLNDLTINHASCIARPTGDNKPPIGGGLTITAGTFNTLDSDGGSSHALTVTGDVSVTGTLTGNASAISMGSLTINDGGTYNATSGTTTITDEGDGSGGTNGYAWYNVTGTYTHNNGTVEFTGNSDTDIREDAFYNLIINGATSSVDFYIRQKDGSSSSSGHIKIFNNLDIQRGGFQRAKSANELSVFGIIDICSGGTGGYFGDTSDTGIYNLGAVNIHNNGTLNLSNGDNNINSIRNIAGTVAQD